MKTTLKQTDPSKDKSINVQCEECEDTFSLNINGFNILNSIICQHCRDNWSVIQAKKELK